MCNLYGVTKWATPALSGHEHQIAGSAAESQAVLWKGLHSDRKGVADPLQLPGDRSRGRFVYSVAKWNETRFMDRSLVCLD
jgi:hypothetical protein